MADGGGGRWHARIDPFGVLIFETPDGDRIRAGVVTGYTPVKGRDYEDGKDGISVVGIEFETAKDGVVLVATVTGGKKYRSPMIRHGEPGKNAYVPVKGRDYFDGENGRTPVKGVDYRDGEDGEDGVGLESLTTRGQDIVATLTNKKTFVVGKIRDGIDGRTPVKGVDYRDGYTPVKDKDYHDGKDGAVGPAPLHEWDGSKLRFELERGENGKPKKWGQWVDLRGPRGTKNTQSSERLGGGFTSITLAQVQQLIENAMTQSPLAGYRIADEDSTPDVKYYGYTKDNNSALWYILRVDHSADPITYRYANGSAGYPAAWAGRAGLTYTYLSSVTGL